MKVGIVTICDNLNFGNKFQNYASIQILEKLGADAHTLLTEKQYNLFKLYLKRLLNCLSGYRLSMWHGIWLRICSFQMFVKRFIHPSMKLLKGQMDINKYDYFVVGSDQVWNVSWYNERKKNIFLLSFAKPSQKVCMAPSFGISSLPEEWKEFFKEQLNTFPYLSVREEDGAEIIKELTGKEAVVLIDPTLMLNADDWRKIEKTSKQRKGKKYIFTYILGQQTAEMQEKIHSIADKNNLHILDIMDKSNYKLYGSGPQEFLDLIDHAELICTDSFHACVFSIIFNKPFLVFDRIDNVRNMSSRINTLLSKLGLERRMPGCVSDKDIFEHNYEYTYELLEKEKEKAYEFLEKSMGLRDED